MGGPGSGASYYHWWRPSKKDVVEGCLTLDANRWAREKILTAGVHKTGGCNWLFGATKESSIGFEVCTLDLANPWVRLHYTVTKTGQALNYTILLATTRPHFGGLRWWFLCPLSKNGRPCGRRVGKLYLPAHSVYYGCRHCHDLTYTSCQESRKHTALYRLLAADMGMDPAAVRRLMNRLGKRR